MKIKTKFIIVLMTFFVSISILSLNSVQAVSVEEAGKYIAEFAVNFFDSHASQTRYGVDGRATAYTGKPSNSSGQYVFDCVGWLSFAVHQATGHGNASFTEFAVPFHPGATGVPNDYPGYFNGFTEVYGKGGSSNKIPLDELKKQLKPGDLVMCIGPRKHVLLYVGDNTLIHATGQGPGPEYGGDSSYGLIKESLDHFYQQYGIESIGRLTETAAASINESNLTTVFGQPGNALTGRWQTASSGGNPVTPSSSSSGTTSNLANKLSVSGMNEDLSLGLRYPKDNNNTSLNSFIDFTLPFLQNWMIPLAMNSGVLDVSEDSEEGKNPFFAYLTIKEAMSDIVVDRYDITKCTLKTKYKVYDVITHKVTIDPETGAKTDTITSTTSVDESANGPKAEEYVSKSFDVNTKYCIKRAHTFDVKIDNEYTYNKYSDSDVENRVNPKQENKEQGAAYSEGGDPGGNSDYTYTIKKGHYVNVTRIWEDEFEIGESSVSEYTVDDVKQYVKTSSTASKTTVNNNTSGEIYNCKKYDLTEEQKIKLAKMVYREFGAHEEGAKAMASHMCNLYEHRVWANLTTKSFYDFITTTTWFAAATRNNEVYDEISLQAVEQCIVNGQRTIEPYVIHYGGYDEMVKLYPGQKGYLMIDGKHGSTKAESKAIVDAAVPHQSKVMGSFALEEGTFYKAILADDGIYGTILFYPENYKEACKSQYTVSGSGSAGTNTTTVNSLDNFLFIGDSLTYGLEHGGSIANAKFMGVIGSSATHWLQWMEGKKTKWNATVDFTDLSFPSEDQINGVCIMLGVNALGGNGSTTAIEDMKKFLDKIRQKYPNKPIYVERVLPTRNGSFIKTAATFNKNIAPYNEAISNYCSQNGLLYIDTSKGYIGSDGQLAEEKSADGVHLSEYKTLSQNIEEAILNTTVTNNSNNPQVIEEDLKDFTSDDTNYYKLLHVDKSINRVDLMNAKPSNYYQYLEKGTEYSNHVGYSRQYLMFGYSQLKKLFDDKFEDSGSLPFVYGASLGYETYDAEYVMEAGTVTEDSGTSNGGELTITGAVDVPQGMEEYRSYTPWNNFNWKYNQYNLITYLGSKNKTLAGNVSKSSENFILYGGWYAIAMVSEFGGTKGNPAMNLNIGDMVFIVLDNGTFYGGMLADVKAQWQPVAHDPNPANQWGHDSGKCIMEFEMWGLNSAHNDPGNVDKRLKQNITQVYKIGNAYDNPEYINNVEGAAESLGLDTSKLIKPNI